MTRFLSGHSCPVAMITRILSGLSGGADDQIFVSSCLVRLMTRFLSGQSCLVGLKTRFFLVCLVGLRTRFLSGQSCLVGLKTRFLFGLSCAAVDHFFVWSVLCGC